MNSVYCINILELTRLRRVPWQVVIGSMRSGIKTLSTMKLNNAEFTLQARREDIEKLRPRLEREKERRNTRKARYIAVKKGWMAGDQAWVFEAWGQTSKANLNKIQILQKRALRLIHFPNKREHAIPLFIRANILPVNMLYYKAISTLMNDIHCKTAPINLIA